MEIIFHATRVVSRSTTPNPITSQIMADFIEIIIPHYISHLNFALRFHQVLLVPKIHTNKKNSSKNSATGPFKYCSAQQIRINHYTTCSAATK
jgi:hypothetical protein